MGVGTFVLLDRVQDFCGWLEVRWDNYQVVKTEFSEEVFSSEQICAVLESLFKKMSARGSTVALQNH